VDWQRGEIISSAYLIEIKDNIDEFCTRPASRKFQSGPASEKARRYWSRSGPLRNGRL